jgi:hypothetical protein
MNQANNVRRVKANEFSIEVGSLFATDGAWQNKYIVTDVISSQEEQAVPTAFSRGCTRFTFVPVESTLIEIQNIGKHYANGRIVPAKRVSKQQLRIYTDKDGNTVVAPPTAKYATAYTHVVSQ